MVDRTRVDGALRHPFWWLALVVLVLNDHVLKGSGFADGTVTGKLSDFAGLLVAPILARAVASRRGSAAGSAAFLSIVVVFAAINVSTEAARSLETVVGWLGIRWRIWTDPSDLVALVVVPFAWRLTGVQLRERPSSAFTARFAVVAGAVGCLATSAPPEELRTRAYVVNQTDGAVELTVLDLDGALDCELVASGGVERFDPAWFEYAVTYALEPRQVLPLDDEQRARQCDAVLVKAEGLSDTLVVWSDGDPVWVPPELERGEPTLETNGVQLIRSGEGLRATVPSEVQVIEARRIPDADRCDDTRGEAFEWSGVPHRRVVTLASVSTDPAGCLVLETTASETAHLCIPEWAFPFEPGQTLTIEGTALPDSSTAVSASQERRLGVRSQSPFALLEVFRAASPSAETLVQDLVGEACVGNRLMCGAVVAPAVVELSDGQLLEPGTVVERSGTDGTTELIYVGRAESVLVGHFGCGVGAERPGGSVDYLTLTTEDTP